MPLRLTGQLAAAFRDEMAEAREHCVDLIASKDGQRFDRPMLTRFIAAIDDGLAHVEVCAAEDYAGPHAAVVRERELGIPAGAEAWQRAYDNYRGTDDRWLARQLAVSIFRELVTLHRDNLRLQWLSVACAAPYGQNDACEDEFVPIVCAAHREVQWFVAASVHTWLYSGVCTAPYLRESLAKLAQRAPGLVDVLRAMREGDEPHARWMATYALELLETGQWGPDGYERLLARYQAVLALAP